MTEDLSDEDVSRGEALLESWKEIAAYLKRDVSTLKRWEKSEGLPVHRHRHQARSSVYAYPSELDAWRTRRQPAGEAPGPGASIRRRPARALAVAALGLVTLATAGDGRDLGTTSAVPREGTVSRLVWVGPLVDPLGTLSPDGRYLAMTDWDTGNLAVREVSTGAVRRLTENDDWNGWAEFPVPSPDGSRIAYAWYNEQARRDLRVYSLETSSARVVYTRPEVDFPRPFVWTPDGTHVLAILARTDRTQQIALIDVEDGAARVLKTLEGGPPGNLTLSPDGRSIVYDWPRGADSPKRDLFLLATDGSRDELLVGHPDDDVVLGWAPDGGTLLFASDRTGRRGIWALPMSGDRAAGPPQLLRPDVPLLRPMGLTRQGALYYCVRTGTSDVYVAALDSGTGAVLSPPAPLSPRFVGWNRSPDWSADGRSVAFVSQRDPFSGPVGSLGGTIVVRSLATGEEREVAPRSASVGGTVRWSPDGRSFLTGGVDAEGHEGLYTLSATTGEATLVVPREPPGFVQFPVWASDGKGLFYLRTTPDAVNRLRFRDLTTGEDREVLSRGTNNVALSPDGRSLAVRLGDAGDKASVLAIVPAGGGEPRELLRLTRPDLLPPWGGLAWTPDGRYVLFARTTEHSGGQPFELWRIRAEGGTPQKTGIAVEGLRHLRVHPDGERIVFNAGHIQHEVWVLEGFLPEPKRNE
jgi:Tol biopolymer transport system component